MDYSKTWAILSTKLVIWPNNLGSLMMRKKKKIDTITNDRTAIKDQLFTEDQYMKAVIAA
jgi:hypothetical protein